MQVNEVMEQLELLGTEQTRKTWRRHGATGAFFGVNIGQMKKMMRTYKLKNNTTLAKELFLTKNADAMYLAGLIVKPKELDFATLVDWVELAEWSGITESIIPWCAAEAGLGQEIGVYCLKKNDDKYQSIAYATLSCHIIVTPDEQLDIPFIAKQLEFVEQTIHQAGNRTKYTMNNFVIAVATSCEPLYDAALQVAVQIGFVTVDMAGTACKVPDAVVYINKTIDRYGRGHKRPTVRC